MRAVLKAAIRHHQAGEFELAAPLYRQVLDQEPDNADALYLLGVLHLQRGEADRAVAAVGRATALRPNVAPFRTTLGQALQGLGRHREAVEQFRLALQRQPDLAVAHGHLGVSLSALGRFDEALPHFQRTVELEPAFPQARTNLGQVLLNLGRAEEALRHFQEAVRLQPDLTHPHHNLGNALRTLGRFGEARSAYQEAVRLDDTLSWSHANVGLLLQQQGQGTEALPWLKKAVDLEPGNAVFRIYLATLHEELGEFAEAEMEFRTALRREPTLDLPHAHLATLLGAKLPDADLAVLEKRLADTDLGAEPRFHLLFALAHVLDARRAFARAAAVLRQANGLERDHLRRNQRDYSPAEHERFVDGLVRVFGAAFFARTAGLGSATRRPVFIFGLPRSGTTLIEQVLASHSRVHGAGELFLVRQSFEALPAALGRPEPPLDCVPHLDAVTIQRLAERHDSLLRGLANEWAERVTDKMPDNYLYLGLLATLFPRAVFIHCRRDLRDVALSCWRTDFHSLRWANDPEHIASRFRQYLRLMEHWRAVLPVPIQEVNYEETVVDLEGMARRLVAACGLEWEPASLAFHRTRRSIRTGSITQVRQPVYTHSVGRWKNYETELGDLFRLLPAV